MAEKPYRPQAGAYYKHVLASERKGLGPVRQGPLPKTPTAEAKAQGEAFLKATQAHVDAMNKTGPANSSNTEGGHWVTISGTHVFIKD